MDICWNGINVDVEDFDTKCAEVFPGIGVAVPIIIEDAADLNQYLIDEKHIEETDEVSEAYAFILFECLYGTIEIKSKSGTEAQVGEVPAEIISSLHIT